MNPRKFLRTLKINNEHGFTLIEILVVILIIVILTAIAIPVFLNQRQKTNDAKVESDAKNMATAIETYFVNNKDATTINRTEVMNMFKKSEGIIMNYVGDRNDWCIAVADANSYVYRNWGNNPLPGVRPYVLYSSKNGGFVKDTHMSNMSCNFGAVPL